MKIGTRLLQILLFGLMSPLLCAQPTVMTDKGTVEGSELPAGGAVFKGIPFAQPPTGALRWQEPRPVQPWAGVRKATEFGAGCIGKGPQSSEDCLYINVWNAEWPARTRKPVMLWIYGGGNFEGTTSDPKFNGESLARHGVVLVSANYRLGIFGFFAHPQLAQESPHRTSGNYGLLDQIAALRWIKANIEKFGGDPNNVTVFGESAGSLDVNVLLASPLTAGLFKRLIGESGPALTVLTRQQGEAKGIAAAGKVGVNAAPDVLAALRKVGPDELVAATGQGLAFVGPELGVIQDGYVLTAPVLQTFEAGRQHKVDMILGSNSRELQRPFFPLRGGLADAVKDQYGPLSDRMMTLLGISGGANPAPHPLHGDAMAQWATDTQFRCGTVQELIWHTRAGNAAYQFEFARAAPGREAVGATHGAEVSYVFGTLGDKPYDAVDRAVSQTMQNYWTNFAKTGDPNGSGLPRWPRFTPDKRAYIEFNSAGPVAKDNLRATVCDVYMANIKRQDH
ncbi:MAG: carboxylesterase family protein [Steroidobacteraceae bacterium]